MTVIGRMDDKGFFMVTDMCYADIPAQAPQPSISVDKYVALVSGLNLAAPNSDPLQVQMLTDFLTGGGERHVEFCVYVGGFGVRWWGGEWGGQGRMPFPASCSPFTHHI